MFADVWDLFEVDAVEYAGDWTWNDTKYIDTVDIDGDFEEEDAVISVFLRYFDFNPLYVYVTEELDDILVCEGATARPIFAAFRHN